MPLVLLGRSGGSVRPRFLSTSMAISVFYGAIINPVSLTEYDIIPRCLLAVGPGGTIIFMAKDIACHLVQDTVAQQGLTGVDIVHLKDGEFIIPGFIDTHTVKFN
jgi:guanine deaminase